MIRNSRRPFYVLVLLAAMTAMAIGSREARAIYGMDMGFFGGFNPAPSPTQFINSHALIRAGQPSTAPGPLRINNLRIPPPTGLETVDLARTTASNRGGRPHLRWTDEWNVHVRPRNNPTQPAAPTPTRGRCQAGFPIGSFFDASRKLAWPSDSPVADDLQGKRDTRIRPVWSSPTKS